MGQTLPAVPVGDLRARLDVDMVTVSDELLQKYVDVGTVLVGAELDPDGDYTNAPNVVEAVYQLAVKLWDMRPRGVGDADLTGDFPSASLPATAGLVRSVRGLLLPSMPNGGVTI